MKMKTMMIATTARQRPMNRSSRAVKSRSATVSLPSPGRELPSARSTGPNLNLRPPKMDVAIPLLVPLGWPNVETPKPQLVFIAALGLWFWRGCPQTKKGPQRLARMSPADRGYRLIAA
jgi:hypothetical protein